MDNSQKLREIRKRLSRLDANYIPPRESQGVGRYTPNEPKWWLPAFFFSSHLGNNHAPARMPKALKPSVMHIQDEKGRIRWHLINTLAHTPEQTKQ